MNNLLEVVAQTAELTKKVGAFIQQEANGFNTSLTHEKGLNQLVSYVDKTAETMLVDGLKVIFPEAGFITEEETIATVLKEYMWVIDPLDGTTNFIHSLPVYSISVALLHNNKPVVGVVYEPNRNELFTATLGGGAFLNNKRIQVTTNTELAKSLLATGFPYYDFENMPKYLNALQTFLKTTRGMRRMGSAAVDLAYVACGRFDGFFEYSLSPWDVAAGVLLVKEAGGKTSTFNGGDNAIFGKEIIAASSAIYQPFTHIIQQAFYPSNTL